MRIALYRGTGFIDKSILFFSRGGYTHAAVLLYDDTVIEAYPFKGVRRRKSLMDKMGKDVKVEVYDVPTTGIQDEIIKKFLTDQLGKGYDYWSVIGFVVYSSKEGRKSYGRWFCSELVFAAFQKAGINLLERVDAWKVSPTIISFTPSMRPVVLQ